MEQMTREQAQETIRDMMLKWDTAMKAVMGKGYSENAAIEIVGSYFSKQLEV